MATANISPPVAPANAPGKLAMSRALGAAFLSHQVAELERAVASSNSNYNGASRRGSGGPFRGGGRGRGGAAKRGGGGGGHRAQGSSDDDKGVPALPAGVGAVVLDASVLLHAPGAVKRWCKDSAGPDLVVPLEVLNTLDLLKKGSTVLAQRARAASRLLESFVGSNTRLRVQRDEAYVPWDELPLSSPHPDEDHEADDILPPPEWLRRTLCCARYEAQTDANGRIRPASSAAVAVAEPPAAAPADASADATPGRHDARADGVLVKAWAPRVSGLRLLAVKPCAVGTNKFSDKANFPDAIVADAPLVEAAPIVAPTTVPRARGKQLFDPKSDDAYGYTDPLHPDSPRFSRASAARKSIQPPAAVVPPRKRDEPVRVVRLLARGEKLDP